MQTRQDRRVLIDFGKDRPWSQYFCCMAAANRDFTRKHPVATKRALRAMLKATDLCMSQPERAARLMVERGVADSAGTAGRLPIVGGGSARMKRPGRRTIKARPPVVLLGNTGRGGRFRSPGQRVRLTGAQAVSLRPVPQGATGADVGLVGRRCFDGCQKAALFCAVYHQRISAAGDGGVPK